MFSKVLLAAAIIPSLVLALPADSDASTPTPWSVQIHPNGNNAKCLDIRAAAYTDGIPVQIYDCNGTGAQKWVIDTDNAKITLAGTNFCLDGSNTPGNNVGMKIWTCYDNLPAQVWYYTDVNRISDTRDMRDQCLDLTNGDLTNGNQVQRYQCTPGNTNQVWTTTF